MPLARHSVKVHGARRLLQVRVVPVMGGVVTRLLLRRMRTACSVSIRDRRR